MTTASGALFQLRHNSGPVTVHANTRAEADRIRADVEAAEPGCSWRLNIRVAS